MELAYISVCIPTGSLDVAVIFEIQDLDESHEELLLNFSVPIFRSPYQLQLQIVSSELHFPLERQIQLSVPGIERDIACQNEIRTLFISRSLFPLNTDSSTIATELLPRTKSPVLKNEPALE